MKHIILGGSAAGINAAEMLRRLDKDCEIVLISKDKEIYSKCILHHYISGHRTVEKLNFVGEDFFTKNNITWIKGLAATKVDEIKKIVELEDKTIHTFDNLLIATGSSSFVPPIENLRGKDNVVGLKTIEDAKKIKEIALKAKNICVIGAGLVGMDAVVGLIENPEVGAKIHLVDFAPKLVSMQLDKESSSVYEAELKKHGVALHLGTKVETIIVDEKNENLVSGMIIEDGTRCDCDLIVVAAGVRSNISFLKGTSVETNKLGLIFNEKGETNIEGIYGAGDVSGVAPIWPVAVKEGIVAASNMAGVKREMDDFFNAKATLNFFNIPTMSLGPINRPEKEFIDEGYKVEKRWDKNGGYRKIVHKDGIIEAALIQGELYYVGILKSLIMSKIDIREVKKSIFDLDYSDFFNINQRLEFEY